MLTSSILWVSAPTFAACPSPSSGVPPGPWPSLVQRTSSSRTPAPTPSSSPSNLISSILFGDGAAAVVVTGQKKPGPRVLVTETYTFPDSLGAMGFDLR